MAQKDILTDNGIQDINDVFFVDAVIPQKKLDADQYSAEDIDGVTENLFGSGNMNVLFLQSGQAGDALNSDGYFQAAQSSNSHDFAAMPYWQVDAGGDIVSPLSSLGEGSFYDAGDNLEETGGTVNDGSSFQNLGENLFTSPQAETITTADGGAGASNAGISSFSDSGLFSGIIDATQTGQDGSNGQNGEDGTPGGDTETIIETVTETIIETVTETVIETVEIVTEILDGVIDNIITIVVNVAGDTVVNIIDNTTTIIEEVLDTVETVTEEVLETVVDIVEEIPELLEDPVETVGDIVETVGDTLTDTVGEATDLLDIIIDAAEDTVDFVTDGVDAITDGLVETVDGISDILPDPLNDVVDTVIEAVGDGLGETTQLVDDVVEGTGNTVQESLDNAEDLVEDVTDIVDALLQDPASLGEALMGAGETVAETLTDLGEGLGGVIENSLSTIFGDVAESFLGTGDENDTDIVLNTGIDFIDNTVDALNLDTVINPIENIVGDIDLDIDIALDLLNSDDVNNDTGDSDIDIGIVGDLLDDDLAQLIESTEIDAVENLIGDVDLDLSLATDILGNQADPLNDDGAGGTQDGLLSDLGDSLANGADGALDFLSDGLNLSESDEDSDLDLDGDIVFVDSNIVDAEAEIFADVAEDIIGDIDSGINAALDILGHGQPDEDLDIDINNQTDVLDGDVFDGVFAAVIDPVEQLTGDIDLEVDSALDLLNNVPSITDGLGGDGLSSWTEQAGIEGGSIFGQDPATDFNFDSLLPDPIGDFAEGLSALSNDTGSGLLNAGSWF